MPSHETKLAAAALALFALVLFTLMPGASAQCLSWHHSTLYAGVPAAHELRADDMDADGDVDLVAFGAHVDVLVNDGAAAYPSRVTLSPGDDPWYGDVGDLDGDGDLDVVASLRGHVDPAGQVVGFGLAVFTNRGNGAFDPPIRVPFAGLGARPEHLALGDMDGDGDLDAVTTAADIQTATSCLVVCLNQAGALGSPTRYASVYPSADFVLADLDADGDLDAAVVHGALWSVAWGDGVGGFAAAPRGSYSNEFAKPLYSVDARDLDADGDVDLVAGRQSGYTYWLNDGAGQFTVRYEVHAFGEWDGAFQVAAVDYDGDGDIDIASNLKAAVAVLENTGAGFDLKYLSGSVWGAALVARDLSRDADVDFALITTFQGFALQVVRDECLLETYCSAKVSSQGCVPAMGWTGTPGLTGPDDFYCTASEIISASIGLLFLSPFEGSLHYQGGTLCVGSGATRWPLQASGGGSAGVACSGTFSQHIPQAQLVLFAATTTRLYGQFLYRDAAHSDGTGFGLTDGLVFMVQP